MKSQTPSIWLRSSAGLAAWLWLASGAEALPTYTPIPLDHPTPQADALFAEAVAGIGDVNGDGVTDLLVGAPQQFVVGNINQGRAFVFGGAERSLLLTVDHPAPQGLALFGSAVAGAGDVNGDGRTDLLVGAPGQRVGGRANQGQAYVLSGADGRLLLILDNPIPQADAAFGAAVAGIGDVNGDGAPDLLVGAPEQDGSFVNEGLAFVFSGADGRLLRTLDEPASPFPALFAFAVAAAGDVNGDGAPDLLVGAPLARVGDGSGRAFVFNGADGSLLRTLDLPIPETGALFAFAVAAAGDVNGDGVPDLLVGAPGKDVSETNQGQALVFSGADASVLLTLDHPNPDDLAGFGETVAGIADVDGDGAPDFLVGAPGPGQDVGGDVRQGRAFVFVSAPMPPPDPDGAGPFDLPTRVACTSARCQIRVTCNRPPVLGTACTNRIDLRVPVPRRRAQAAAVMGQRQRQRRLRVFARSNATNVPPGQTANVGLRLTPLGRRIVKTSPRNSLRGVIEIRNTPGTVIDTTRVRIRLRRR
ncbi:MAG: FG-GAP-like repeat-containing protein [Gammaproteobacteria bacterium]